MAWSLREAYAWLVRLTGGGKLLSKRALAKLSGLDRTRTLPNALNGLIAMSLAEVVGNKYRAMEAPAAIFSYKPASGEDRWYKRLNGFRLLVPTSPCPLSGRMVAVFSLLHSPNMLGTGPAQIAGILGISKRTASRALSALIKAGLINGLHQPLQPDAQKLLYWRDDNHKFTENNPVGWTNVRSGFETSILDQLFHNWPEHPWAALFGECIKIFVAENYDPFLTAKVIEDAVLQLKYVKPAARFFFKLPDKTRYVQKQTARNRSNGSFLGTSSFGLFKKVVADLVEGIQGGKK